MSPGFKRRGREPGCFELVHRLVNQRVILLNEIGENGRIFRFLPGEDFFLIVHRLKIVPGQLVRVARG